ncbi:MAG: radical SAM/SPASM domain-containing protein [Candidatus Omnitrophota bacterium]
MKRLMTAILLFLKYATFKKIINFLGVEAERKMGKIIVEGKPYFIKIQVTNMCDAGCRYCLKERPEDSLGKMSLADFKAIIDKVKNYAYMVALHYSGEPLLNEAIYEMAEYAHLNKIATYMSTNLQNFRREDNQRMLTCGLDLLTVAIDGTSERTYKYHRKKGTLAKVLDNISILVETKKKNKSKYPIINLQFIVTSYNEHEALTVKALAKKLRVDSFDLKPVGTYDKKLLPKNHRYLRSVYKKNNFKRRPCWWLWSARVVLWDCKIIPCCMLPFNKNNLANHDFFSIGNLPLYQKLRRYSYVPDRDSGCGECLIPYGSVFSQTI